MRLLIENIIQASLVLIHVDDFMPRDARWRCYGSETLSPRRGNQGNQYSEIKRKFNNQKHEVNVHILIIYT